MNIEVLFALFKIAQGIDPDEKEDDGNTGTEGNASKEQNSSQWTLATTLAKS